MQVVIKEGQQDEIKIVIHCKSKDDAKIKNILSLLQKGNKKIIVLKDKETMMLYPNDILYAEYIDEKVYVYTESDVYHCLLSLTALEQDLEFASFVRCSKSMIVNLLKIEALKSDIGGKIIITLCNGERLLVSRKYASVMRNKIKGGTNQ